MINNQGYSVVHSAVVYDFADQTAFPKVTNRYTSPDFNPMAGKRTAKENTETLSHFDATGKAHMVEIGNKAETHRIAIASGTITMKPETLALVKSGTAKKGDVLGVARIAAIQAAKKTPDLIPLCHPIMLTKVAVEFSIDDATHSIICTVQTECKGQTGVEMEALTAVQIGLLTIYDMCKAVDRGMIIRNVMVLQKKGGKSINYLGN